MSGPNPKLDRFFDKASEWQDEMRELRRICLASDLTEEMKWGKPCYAYDGGNVAIIQPFTKYCALMFFKGTLLKDDKDLLVSPGEHTRAAKQLRITGLDDVHKLERDITNFLEQGIELEKTGAEVGFEKDAELEVPKEFQSALDDDAALRSAFKSLTPGRQRGYLLHFSGAKQSKTRASRVEKAIPQIMEGRGLHD